MSNKLKLIFMKNLKHLYLVLSLLLVVPLAAQEQHQWHPIQIEKLGLKASFYEVPAASTEQKGKETNYRFTNIIKEKEHPNKSYLISIWETSDSTDIDYPRNKEEELTTQKLHSNSLQLVSKSTITRGGYALNYYQLKNNKGEFIHYCIGCAKKKVYSAKVECKKEEPFNSALLEFMQNFTIYDPINQPYAIKLTDLNYTVHFPYAPDIYRINLPETHILYQTIATAKAPEKEVETTVWLGDKEEKIKTAQCLDSISHYQISETVFTDEVPLEKLQENSDGLFQETIHSLISLSNGRLIESHEIKKGDAKGIALAIQTQEGNVRHYQVFLINRTLYAIEIELAYKVRKLCGSAIHFFDSFQHK